MGQNSKNIDFWLYKAGQSHQAQGVINGLKKVVKIYEDRGFKLDTIHSDNEFYIEKVKEEFTDINFDFRARDEHDGIIERSIKTVKEHGRCIYHNMLYEYYTHLMTQTLIENVVYWLNAFSNKNGVSKTIRKKLHRGENHLDFWKICNFLYFLQLSFVFHNFFVIKLFF